MKKIVLGMWMLCAALVLNAADADWMTDFEKAKAKAKQEKKLILLDFTGSDWCPPCIQLKKNVFSTDEFAKYAKDNLVLMEVDFPRRTAQSDQLKKANEKLKNAYGPEGFPTLVLVDATGKELGRQVGYSGEKPAAFIAKVEGWKATKS
jgi:protein disulfide-isomerase